MRKIGPISIAVAILLVLLTVPRSALGQEAFSPSSVSFKVSADGFAHVQYNVDTDITYPRIDVPIFGSSYQNPFVVGPDGFPVDFELTQGSIIVDTLGVYRVRIDYDTPDLVSQISTISLFSVEVPIEATVVMPKDMVILSLNVPPLELYLLDGKSNFLFPAGGIEVAYSIPVTQAEMVEPPLPGEPEPPLPGEPEPPLPGEPEPPVDLGPIVEKPDAEPKPETTESAAFLTPSTVTIIVLAGGIIFVVIIAYGRRRRL